MLTPENYPLYDVKYVVILGQIDSGYNKEIPNHAMKTFVWGLIKLGWSDLIAMYQYTCITKQSESSSIVPV